MKQKIPKKYEGLNPNDVVFTPRHIAKRIVEMFNPSGKVLEPCKGEGSFLEFLPKETQWCEITEGKDFFDFNDKVDWIVTNPPYSNFNEFLAHSFELADNVVFLVPIAKVLKSWGTIQTIKEYGGIKKIYLIPANRCGFPFGFPCGAFHFVRGYTGATQFEYAPKKKLVESVGSKTQATLSELSFNKDLTATQQVASPKSASQTSLNPDNYVQSEGVAPMKFKILIACEESQEVCKAFRNLGHEAYSCDILPCSGGHPEWHIQGDVLPILEQDWDMVIAFPPCTHLAVSGAAWFAQKIKDGRQQEGIDFFMKFANCKCPRVAIENPVGIMSTKWRKPNQIIQPYQFGEPFSKKTCLWLKGLPNLKSTNLVDKGEQVKFSSGKSMPKWYSDAFKLPPKERSIARSKTFPGIAQAMAKQWSEYLEQLIATPSDSATQVSKADEHNIRYQVTQSEIASPKSASQTSLNPDNYVSVRLRLTNK